MMPNQKESTFPITIYGRAGKDIQPGEPLYLDSRGRVRPARKNTQAVIGIAVNGAKRGDQLIVGVCGRFPVRGV